MCYRAIQCSDCATVTAVNAENVGLELSVACASVLESLREGSRDVHWDWVPVGPNGKSHRSRNKI